MKGCCSDRAVNYLCDIVCMCVGVDLMFFCFPVGCSQICYCFGCKWYIYLMSCSELVLKSYHYFLLTYIIVMFITM